jgi:predicted CXXCH cytochrome family protein
MNFSRTALIPIAVLILFLRLDGTSFAAFHAGGVGPCDACHSMHNAAGAVNNSLLKASDPSSTCLNCHERAGDTGPTSFHVSTAVEDMPEGSPPRQLTPGGDFGWLKKTYTWAPDQTQAPVVSDGERHGHNIVAADYLYYADMTNSTAPQGTYVALNLGCISCHDPHGKYRREPSGLIATTGTPIRGSGSYASSVEPFAGESVGTYRMLAGRNYSPRSLGGTDAFPNDPPAAVAPDVYNRAETDFQTRVAYGSGMTEWCQNCHTDMHTVASSGTSTTPVTHPVGATAKLGLVVSGNYSSYINSGDPAGGSASSAFLSLVPFEEGTTDYTTLKTHAKTDNSYLSGPDAAGSQVMCLTCHRAHASGWDGAMRWNSKTDYIVYNGFYSQEGQAYQPYGQGRRELEAQKAYYDMLASRFTTTTVLNQDSLCHKCHPAAIP